MDFFNGVWSKKQPLDRTGARKSSFEFLKPLASTLNTAAQQTRSHNILYTSQN